MTDGFNVTAPQADANINAVRPPSATPHRTLAFVTFTIRRLVGGDRHRHLTLALAQAVESVNLLAGKKMRLLDYGCGNMAVSLSIHEKGLVSGMTCVDTYDLPENARPPGIEYRKITGGRLDFPDRSFDAALIVDVLHHAGINHAVGILQDVARCSRYIIVKDHFEHGFFSRRMLRLSDWFGNAAYGVPIPKRYFDSKSWQRIIARAKLREIELKAGVKIYEGLFGLLMPPRYHFISVLTAA